MCSNGQLPMWRLLANLTTARHTGASPHFLHDLVSQRTERRSALTLPVAGAVDPGVGAGRVFHDDGVTGAEVVIEPPGVGRADVDAAVTDVALPLIVDRPGSAVHE